MLFSWMLSDSPGFQSGRKEFNRFRFLIDSVRQKKTNRMMFLKIKRGFDKKQTEPKREWKETLAIKRDQRSRQVVQATSNNTH